MDAKMEVSEPSPPVEIIEVGQVSKITRGSTTLFPWFESAPPPFDRYCPVC
jgi:hypothetical protein